MSYASTGVVLSIATTNRRKDSSADLRFVSAFSFSTTVHITKTELVSGAIGIHMAFFRASSVFQNVNSSAPSTAFVSISLSIASTNWSKLQGADLRFGFAFSSATASFTKAEFVWFRTILVAVTSYTWTIESH